MLNGKQKRIHLKSLKLIFLLFYAVKRLENHYEIIWIYSRNKRSNEDEESENSSKENKKSDKGSTVGEEKEKNEDCDHKVKIDAFGGNYTLCLFVRPFKDEPIVKNSYDILNVSIFNNLNVSTDESINTFDLYSAMGHVIGGIWNYIQEMNSIEHQSNDKYIILK